MAGFAALLLVLALWLAIKPASSGSPGSGGSQGSRATRAHPGVATAATRTGPRRPAVPAGAPAARAPATSVARGPVSLAVGLRVLRLWDGARRRLLVTYVRYPATGGGGLNASAATSHGPFPLVVFGHGFALTPARYTALLHAWAQAGYVVAAPVFPFESADAPGGPNESDLVHQPADMRFVITRMLAMSRSAGPLHGLVNEREVAVSGHSDGGDTALAVSYDRYFHDARVRAAVILSGAEIPGVGGFTFPPHGSPLLAIQGSADSVNPPSSTREFFAPARRPKFLLTLLGGGHEGPYSSGGAHLALVQRTVVAFLDRYLKRDPGAAARMASAGHSRLALFASYP